MNRLLRPLTLISSLFAGGTAIAANETVPHTVVSTHDGFEVRAYAPHINAQVTVSGSYTGAVSSGFRVLAGYIFGGNAPQAKIDMTTPVTATTAGTKIDMTTPVGARPEGDRWTVTFTMPSAWTMDTLPKPDDGRIELVQVPAQSWAVRTFSGRMSNDDMETELATLRDKAKAAGVEVMGEPLVAQFDPPWVLGPWRTNEVRLAVR